MLGKLLEQHLGLSGIKVDKLFNLKLFSTFFSEKVPFIVFSHDDNENFFRTPEQLIQNKGKYKNSKVIFLVRNPIDVLVSSFFEKTKRNKLGKREDSFWKPITGNISDYINEKNGGFDTIIEFYNIWYRNKNIPKNFMLLRYEDLQNDTLNQLKRVVDFIGINDIKQEVLKEAINYSCFNNMKEIEKNSGVKTDKLKPSDKNDDDTYKTRRGKIHGFVDYFNDEEIEFLKKKMTDNLHEYFGY